MTPTARSLHLLRKSGYLAQVVEQWVSVANIRRDLFGCIDIVAVRSAEPGVLGVQATTGGNLAARVKKSRQIAALRVWLDAGNRFQVWGWKKAAREGKCKWVYRVVTFDREDLDRDVVLSPSRTRKARQKELFEG